MGGSHTAGLQWAQGTTLCALDGFTFHLVLFLSGLPGIRGPTKRHIWLLAEAGFSPVLVQGYGRKVVVRRGREWIQSPHLPGFPGPVHPGATLAWWARGLSPWAWLISLISWHRGTELRPAGSQTLLPAGRNPPHLRCCYHCPVPESKGGYRGPWGEGVGSPACCMLRRALVLASLKHG